MTATIDVDGMGCGGCEESVEEALRTVPGVEEASADREHGVAKVEGNADAEDLIAAVEDAGYDASA